MGGTGLLSGIVSIAAGNSHTCALSATGAVYCWGYNPSGQLGNNSTMSSYVPVQVTGL
jgi:alpha-tubulin suppressor-like RCC1 family protein